MQQASFLNAEHQTKEQLIPYFKSLIKPITSWSQVVLGFNNISTLMGRFVASPREREETVEETKEREREEKGK